MTIVGRMGAPDIFLTMTVNPNDPDIQNNLPKNVPAHYMPQLVARVAFLTNNV